MSDETRTDEVEVEGHGNPVEGNPVEGNPVEAHDDDDVVAHGFRMGNPVEGNPVEGNPVEGNPVE